MNKPCPFCGKERLIISTIENQDGEQDSFKGEIYCPICRITIKSCIKYWSHEEAINSLLATWNTRNGGV